MPVTQEVPVTVEVDKLVEVTREVRVPQEVPVTVTVHQTVEVTREVASLQTVEVTREVPVTRIVAVTPGPTPEGAPTIVPDSPTPAPTATPAPATTPSAAATPTPTPGQRSRFLSWVMEHEQSGTLETFWFRNTALDYSIGEQAPMLTYWCDSRARRGMYINWRHPITTASSNVPSSARDPFSEYRDIPLYALLEYAEDLLEFVDDLRLSDREQREMDEIWEQVQERWFVGQGTPPALADEPTPDDLVDLLSDRTHRSADINLNFFSEIIDPDRRPPHGPPVLDTITGTWLVLSDHTQIHGGALGELRPIIRRHYDPRFDTGNTRPVMTASVIRPGQPTRTRAEWDISGIRQVLDHCEAIRR